MNFIKSKITAIFVSLLLLSSVGCNVNLQELKNVKDFTAKEAKSNQLVALKKTETNMKSDVQIMATLDNSQIGVAEPVIVKLNVENKTSETIKLDFGHDRKENLKFILTYPNDERSELPQYSATGGLIRIGKVIIKPGDTYTQELVLNEWADFSQKGKYLVEGQVITPITDAAGKIITSNPKFKFDFEIVPDNQESLRKLSEKLLDIIKETDSYEARASAANALTRISSPVVIPYLKEALKGNNQTDPFIINKLREMGGEIAVEVLISAYNDSPDSEKLALIIGSLKTIEMNSSDENLKMKIQQALSS